MICQLDIVETLPKFNIERGESDIPNTYIHYNSLYLLGSVTSIQSAGVNLVLWTPLMMELCFNLIKTLNTSAFIQRTYIYLDVGYFYLFQITQGFAIGKAWGTKGVIRSRRRTCNTMTNRTRGNQKPEKDMQYNDQ